jgi:hypothetical protein
MPMNTKRKSTTMITVIIVFSLFLQLIPLLNDPNSNASAQPEEIDNGDFTITAKWDFTDPSDFNLTNTIIQNDAVNLSLATYYWNQTTKGDFDSGSHTNTNSTVAGDVILGEEMKTINIISNGELTSDQDWSFIPGEDIRSWYSANR